MPILLLPFSTPNPSNSFLPSRKHAAESNIFVFVPPYPTQIPKAPSHFLPPTVCTVSTASGTLCKRAVVPFITQPDTNLYPIIASFTHTYDFLSTPTLDRPKKLVLSFSCNLPSVFLWKVARERDLLGPSTTTLKTPKNLASPMRIEW